MGEAGLFTVSIAIKEPVTRPTIFGNEVVIVHIVFASPDRLVSLVSPAPRRSPPLYPSLLPTDVETQRQRERARTVPRGAVDQSKPSSSCSISPEQCAARKGFRQRIHCLARGRQIRSGLHTEPNQYAEVGLNHRLLRR